MSQPFIVIFVGIPGSGKTTFAKLFAKHTGAVILNSDSLRIAMWKTREAIDATHALQEERTYNNQLTFGAMDYAAQQVLAAGHSVVYDCNANKLSERQEKHDIAAAQGVQSIVVRIKVPYEVSLQRILERDETHDSRRILPEKAHAVLDRFISEIEEPHMPERVIEIDGTAPFSEQLKSFNTALAHS